MSALPDLQGRFQAAVLAGDATGGCAAAGPPWLSGHFEIYTNAYRGRLIEALSDNFPALLKAMGDESFHGLAEAYIAAEPSTNRSVRWFGHRLVEFMAQQPDLVTHPALTDLARMDWALRGAFDAADASVLTVQEVAAIPAEEWSGWRFKLHPSVRLVDLEWEVEPVWHALNQEGGEEVATEPPQRRAHLLLAWRRELDCQWRSAEPVEAAALRAVEAGKSFAEVCLAIAEAGAGDAPLLAASLLRQWVEQGMLAVP